MNNQLDQLAPRQGPAASISQSVSDRSCLAATVSDVAILRAADRARVRTVALHGSTSRRRCEAPDRVAACGGGTPCSHHGVQNLGVNSCRLIAG